MTNHSPECLERQRAFREESARLKAEQDAYDAQWPGFCRSCNGGGYFYSAGTRESPPETEACGCIIDGKCPRCGEEGIYYEDGIGDRPVQVSPEDQESERPCLYCGWDASHGGRPEGDGYYAECDCWSDYGVE